MRNKDHIHKCNSQYNMRQQIDAENFHTCNQNEKYALE